MTNVTQFTGSFAPEQVIRKLVADNPKKPEGKSYARFALYEDGITVAQYVQRSVDAGNTASLAHADLRWDTKKGFIAVSEATEASKSDTVAATASAPKAKPAKTKPPVRPRSPPRRPHNLSGPTLHLPNTEHFTVLRVFVRQKWRENADTFPRIWTTYMT